MIGSNLFTKVTDTLWLALDDESGLGYLGKCIGTPPVTADLFAHGCLMIQEDSGTGNNSLWEMQGTTAIPTWGLISNTPPGSLTLGNGHIYVGDAGNVAQDLAMSGDATIDNLGVITVTQINGVIVDSIATNANMLLADGTQWNSVAMAGDAIVDNAGNVTVGRINGVKVDSTPTNANMMVADGTQWNSVALSKDVTIDNAGLVTVVGLQGNTVLASPSVGNALTFDGTFWRNNMVPQLIGTLLNANFNAVADQNIDMTATGGSIFYITDIILKNPTVSLMTADGAQFWSGAAQSGVEYGVIPTASIAKLTGATKMVSLDLEIARGGVSPVLNLNNDDSTLGTSLIFSLQTPQGAPARADVLVFGYVLA